jgi:transcriptional/translational regulatory protein YebC/TACO1
MSGDLKDKAASGVKKAWCNTWTFTVNNARRAKIMGRKGLGFWQQRKIDKVLAQVGAHTFQAVEQGDANPLNKPEVDAAIQKAKDLKYVKEKNELAIQAIRERIKSSRVIATPDQPGATEEENPEVPG